MDAAAGCLVAPQPAPRRVRCLTCNVEGPVLAAGEWNAWLCDEHYKAECERMDAEDRDADPVCAAGGVPRSGRSAVPEGLVRAEQPAAARNIPTCGHYDCDPTASEQPAMAQACAGFVARDWMTDEDEPTCARPFCGKPISAHQPSEPLAALAKWQATSLGNKPSSEQPAEGMTPELRTSAGLREKAARERPCTEPSKCDVGVATDPGSFLQQPAARTEVPPMPKYPRAGHVSPIHAAATQIAAERDALALDLEAAAGELLVPIPVPGTDTSRLLCANVLMRRERDEARAQLAEAQAKLRDARRQERERCKGACVEVIERHATWGPVTAEYCLEAIRALPEEEA